MPVKVKLCTILLLATACASSVNRAGFLLLTAAMLILIFIVPTADAGIELAIPLVLAGSGLGLLASQLNNYALAPISEERVGEAAGVTSATSSFGLSFGLAVAGAILLATLSISFTSMAQASSVLPPEDQQRVAEVLEENAQVVSDTQLQELLAGQPQAIQDEIIRINDEARSVALQVALSLSLLAAVIGAFNAFRMMRLPDPEPSSAVEGLALA